jgi:hypothetical protein
MPSKQEWEQMKANRVAEWKNKYGEELNKYTKDEKSLVDMINNELAAYFTGPSFREEYANFGGLIADSGEGYTAVLKYAFEERNLDPNVVVGEDTVFEHYLKMLIEQCDHFEECFEESSLEVFIENGASVFEPNIVRMLVDSELKDEMDEMDDYDEDDAEVEPEIRVRAYLLNKLASEIDQATLSEYDWTGGSIYYDMLRKEMENKSN